TASVNYPREMLPVETGFDEAAGWVYENNPAGQALLRKGPYWYNAIPIVELADRYDIQYIVAASAPLVVALANDPRWSRVLETADLVLYEANRRPSFVEANGRDARVLERAYVWGGGYKIRIAATAPAGDPTASNVLVKTNYSPAWRAHAA